MIELRSYLGNHEGHRPGQLTERETAMLVICAGRRAGFVVKTEVRVQIEGRSVRGAIDVGWYVADQLIAVWEIDGQDAGETHFLGHQRKGTAGNTAKFLAADALFKVQVLYSLKNSLGPKTISKQASIRKWLDGAASLVTDEELMATHGIENWIEKFSTYSGERTKKAAVTKALQEFIARREQRKVLDLMGKLEWDRSFDYKAERSRS